MVKPLVTIVTPSFNQGEFIEATIQSVLDQDYDKVEYIVVDGGSTDETLTILRKYESRLTWISEPDQGQSDAINKGWRMASGDILAWLNSDDMYMPGAVRAAVDTFLQSPHLGMVYGNARIIGRQGELLRDFNPSKFGNLWVKWFGSLPQPTTFFNADVIKQVGMLDIKLNYSMDHDLFLRVAQATPIVYLPRFQAIMRYYMGTKTSKNIMKNWQEKIVVLKRYNRFWFLSWIYFCYSRYRLWNLLPSTIQMRFRKLRGSITDVIILENKINE